MKTRHVGKAKPAPKRKEKDARKKLVARFKELRGLLTESVAIHNELAAMLGTPTLWVREVKPVKTRARRK